MVDARIPVDAGSRAEVTVLETLDVSAFNTDLVDDRPTVDVAFYITEEGPLDWADLATNITRAKRIFSVAGVQLRVSSALRIAVPSSWQTLDADDLDVPITPEYLGTDLYAHLEELRARPTARNRAIFEAIVSYFPTQASGVPAANTIHVVTLELVPIAYYEWTGSAWSYAAALTGGLSFPPYMYADRIPENVRGVITLSFAPGRETRALAHEIGHKIIDVSHEGVGVCPAFAANGPELMLFGDGENIPQGPEGRWHRERLLLSPFVYTLDRGVANFENVYQDGGVYRDGLYGDFVVTPPCADPSL